MPTPTVESLQAEKADLEKKHAELQTQLKAEKDEKAKLSGSVTKLEGEKKALDERVTKLEAELKTWRDAGGDKDAALRAQVTSLQAEVTKLQAERKAEADASKAEAEKKDQRILTLEREGQARELREVITSGIKAGKLLPAEVDGWDKDPLKWLEGSAFKSVDALKALVAARPELVKLGGAQPGSGSSNQPGGSAKEKLQTEITKLQAEKKITFDAARQELRATKPELYAEAMKEYAHS